MKKRIFSLLLCLAMVISLFASCSGGDSGSSSSSDSATTAAGSDGATTAAANGETTAANDATASGEEVTIEFIQWWEPELPEGEFRKLMDQFEEKNPGIKVKLVSGPYASTKEQVIAGAAAKTMSDVVGLDGAWVSDFVKQGSIANLTQLMSDNGYDSADLASQVQIDGATYMIPVVNFVYPVFVNEDIREASGVEKAPSNRTEFADAAKKMTDESKNQYGWILPLSLETPNGIQNDVMSWVWASGKSMLKDGKPDVTNADVKSAVEFIKGMYDEGVVSKGAFQIKEQDKVEEFTNGRVGMMISSLAHINTIRERNANLKFTVEAIPSVDGYEGERGMPYASWGIGVSEHSEHKAEAWKLVEFLMSEEVNSKLSSIANAFPGNSKSVPDFVETDELFKKAFEIYQAGYPANEFTGLPVAEELMRIFDEELQKTLEGNQSIDDMLQKVQDEWTTKF